ncbi:MAG: hypothetical protein ACE15F_20300 [bacterium]
MTLRICCLIGVFLLSLTSRAQSPPATVQLFLDETQGPMEIGRMALGQGGLSEEPMWDNRVAEIRALQPRIIRLFIQEYFDLLPQRGKYHFDTLDRSVDTILQTGAEPLMCICFKPAVLFPQINQDIVEPNDYEEWDRLIFNLARHYRGRNPKVRYWEIGNEPDIGEDGGCPYRFQPDSYVHYYRHTANAILQADPDALVGGPALAGVRSPILPRLLAFCGEESVPLHFISWHIYSSDPIQVRKTIEYAQALLREYPRLHPETFLDEWNIDLGTPPSDPRFQPCYIAETIWRMKDAGLDYSCYYHIRDYHVSFERFARFMSPGGTAFMTQWWNRRPQWDGLFDYQNTIRPAYFLFKLLSRLTGVRLRMDSSLDTVHGFAAWDETFQLYNVLVWNFSSSPVNIEIVLNNPPGKLRARPLLFDASHPSSDENIRLRPEAPLSLEPENPVLKNELEPYGIRFWHLEKLR